jgi:hypothetical protein
MKNHLSRRTLRLSVLSTLFTLLAFLLLVVGASAHTVSTHDGAIPNAGATFTTITHNGKVLAFNPTSAQIFLAHTNSIQVINSTGRTQTVLNASGKVVMQLVPGAKQFLTFSSTGTYVYHLKGHAKVTFTAIVS